MQVLEDRAGYPSPLEGRTTVFYHMYQSDLLSHEKNFDRLVREGTMTAGAESDSTEIAVTI